jgi:hypothetical protein
MMNGKHILGALAGASLLPLVAAAPAQAQNQTYLDLQAGVGYSSNPELRLDGAGSAFGRISAFGYHGWGNERSNSNLSAYVENSTYFRRYGNRQLFTLNAANTTQATEKLRLFGNLGFAGDFGAQLSSRFFGVPTNGIPADSVVPESTVIIVNPDLAALNQRSYRVNGLVGASYVISPRDFIDATFGAQRVFYTGSTADLLDYTQLDTSVAWRRQVNERLSAGIRLIANRADYSLGRSVLSYGPQITADLRLDETLRLSGAVGFVKTERDFGPLGNDNSTDLALDASICRELEFERLCGRIARRTQSAAIGTAPTSSSATAEYSRRLNARDYLQAAAALVRTDGVRDLAIGNQSFYSLSASFDRKINPRLSAGVNVAARKYTISGPDPKADLGASLYIRNRFGSVR